MPRLTDSLHDWDTEQFPQTLKREMQALGVAQLPLIGGVSHGGVPDDKHQISVSLLSLSDQQDKIEANVGVFFTETLAGCTCGEEPISMNAYCELKVLLDKATGETEFSLLTS